MKGENAFNENPFDRRKQPNASKTALPASLLTLAALFTVFSTCFTPLAYAQTGSSDSYNAEIAVGTASSSGASADYNSSAASDAALGTYYSQSYEVFLGLPPALAALPPAPLVSIEVTSPGPYSYQSTALPNLSFTVKGAFASYYANYTLNGVTAYLGAVANNSPYTTTLSLSTGSHSINVTAWNGSVAATSTTIAFQVIETKCSPNADPSTAPAPCALAFNITSPKEWQTFVLGDNVTLAFEVQNSLTGSIVFDACVNASYLNATLFSNGEATKNVSFNANETGTAFVEVNASRPGCTPASKKIYFYVLPSKAVAAPEMHPAAIAIVVLLALFIIHKNMRASNA